jgi:hypothetical protein
MRLHFFSEMGFYGTKVTFQDIGHLVYLVLVFPGRLQSFAGAHTIFDMVFQANLVFALADLICGEVEFASAQRK